MIVWLLWSKLLSVTSFTTITPCLWARRALLYLCSVWRFLGHTWISSCPPSRCLDGWYSLWESGPALSRFLLAVFKKPHLLPLLVKGFVMEPQCNLLMFLSLPLPVLPKEHLWPPAVSNVLPCLCDPTWSFLAHCSLEDGEEAGCRHTQSLHVTSLWVRKLLHHVVSQSCSLTLWPSVRWHTGSSPAAVWKTIALCYWAEGSVFWGMTVKQS